MPFATLLEIVEFSADNLADVPFKKIPPPLLLAMLLLMFKFDIEIEIDDQIPPPFAAVLFAIVLLEADNVTFAPDTWIPPPADPA